MPRTTALILAFLLVAAAPSGAVIRVPDDVSTIGDALLTAAANETILVAPGTYHVNLEWPATPGIKLVGENGALETILDGRDDDGGSRLPHTERTRRGAMTMVLRRRGPLP